MKNFIIIMVVSFSLFGCEKLMQAEFNGYSIDRQISSVAWLIIIGYAAIAGYNKVFHGED